MNYQKKNTAVMHWYKGKMHTFKSFSVEKNSP